MFAERFETIELLGKGSFGEAHLVRHRDGAASADSAGFGQLLVAKEIWLGHLEAKQRQVALAESEVLRSLDHPNIIGYITSFLEGPKLYIVMEYADGGDLQKKLTERQTALRSFQEREIMAIYVQICLALVHVHSRSILHRDLKPMNVFMTKQGVVKLGDFGIAKVLESGTAGAQTAIGTPLYLSPEICNNEPYGFGSDLWSLGVLLYELAALRHPFQASSVAGLVVKICNSQPPPLPSIYSRELTGIILGFLAKDPRQRTPLERSLRGAYAQRYLQALLGPSPGALCGSGGSPVIGQEPSRRVAAAGLPSRRRSDESARPTENVRSEFLRNREAALAAKRRAESSEVGQRVPSPDVTRRAGSVEERRSCELSGEERIAEVRRRAAEERERRDADRKLELGRAAAEARRDRQLIRERMLAQQRGTPIGAVPVVSQSAPAGTAERTRLASHGDAAVAVLAAGPESSRARACGYNANLIDITNLAHGFPQEMIASLKGDKLAEGNIFSSEAEVTQVLHLGTSDEACTFSLEATLALQGSASAAQLRALLADEPTLRPGSPTGAILSEATACVACTRSPVRRSTKTRTSMVDAEMTPTSVASEECGSLEMTLLPPEVAGREQTLTRVSHDVLGACEQLRKPPRAPTEQNCISVAFRVDGEVRATEAGEGSEVRREAGYGRGCEGTGEERESGVYIVAPSGAERYPEIDSGASHGLVDTFGSLGSLGSGSLDFSLTASTLQASRDISLGASGLQPSLAPGQSLLELPSAAWVEDESGRGSLSRSAPGVLRDCGEPEPMAVEPDLKVVSFEGSPQVQKVDVAPTLPLVYPTAPIRSTRGNRARCCTVM